MGYLKKKKKKKKKKRRTWSQEKTKHVLLEKKFHWNNSGSNHALNYEK